MPVRQLVYGGETHWYNQPEDLRGFIPDHILDMVIDAHNRQALNRGRGLDLSQYGGSTTMPARRIGSEKQLQINNLASFVREVQRQSSRGSHDETLAQTISEILSNFNLSEVKNAFKLAEVSEVDACKWIEHCKKEYALSSWSRGFKNLVDTSTWEGHEDEETPAHTDTRTAPTREIGSTGFFTNNASITTHSVTEIGNASANAGVSVQDIQRRRLNG